eukprot:Hpha_TRINITY_DN16957_c0_g3::TRINITY_DN16957_c0_g3_i1::g.56791::m.56791
MDYVRGAVGAVKRSVSRVLNIPAESIARFVVVRSLKRFFRGLDGEQFKELSLEHGTVRLENLHLAVDVINDMLEGVPLRLVDGKVGRVTVAGCMEAIRGERRDATLRFEFSDFDFVFEWDGPKGSALDPSGLSRSAAELKNSVLLGEVTMLDCASLAPPEGADEEIASIHAAIDKVVQRIGVGLRDGRVSVRFPAGAGRRDVFRIELPWAELEDHPLPTQRHQDPEASGVEVPRFTRKKITFQSALCLLETARPLSELVASAFSLHGSAAAGEAEALEEDLILAAFANQDRNEITVRLPVDPSHLQPGEGIGISVKLQSAHGLLRPRHVHALKRIAAHFGHVGGDTPLPPDDPPDAAQRGDEPQAATSAPELKLDIKIFQLLLAIIAVEAPTPGVWDPILEEMRTNPVEDRPPMWSAREMAAKSPSARLGVEHLSLELGGPGAEPVRHGQQQTPGSFRHPALSVEHRVGASNRSDVVSTGIAVGSLRVSHCVPVPEGYVGGSAPSVVAEHERLSESGLIVRDILVLLPALADDGVTQLASLAVKTRSRLDNGTLIQNTFVRVSPWLSLHLKHLPRLVALLKTLVAPAMVPRSRSDFSALSLLSDTSDGKVDLEQQHASPMQASQHESPLSSAGGDFEAKGSRVRVLKHIPRVRLMLASQASEFDDTYMRPTRQAADSEEKETPNHRRQRVQREVRIQGKIFATTCLFSSAGWESKPLVGPYLRSVLEHHTIRAEPDTWLDRSLNLELEDWEFRLCTDTGEAAVDDKGAAQDASTLIQLNVKNLRLFIDGHGEDTLINLTGGETGSGIAMSIPLNPDPMRFARETRGCDLLTPEEYLEHIQAGGKWADVVLSARFESGVVELKRSTMLLLIHMTGEITDCVDAIDPPSGEDGTFNAPASTGACIPMGLVQPVGPESTLEQWQHPGVGLQVELWVGTITLSVHAPRCFPASMPPPATIPYPGLLPCHLYHVQFSEVSLATAVHCAPDTFVRVSVSAQRFWAWEEGDDGDVQLLRSCDDLYGRCCTGSTEDPADMLPAVRIAVAVAQCSKQNPAFAMIGDRQEISVKVDLQRCLYTHIACREGDHPVLALAQMFSDVQRYYGDPEEEE